LIKRGDHVVVGDLILEILQIGGFFINNKKAQKSPSKFAKNELCEYN